MRRLLTFLRDHEPRIVVAWVVLTLGLGVVGLRAYLEDPRFGPSDLLYQSVQLFVLQLQVLPGKTRWTLDVARWSSAAVSFYAVLRAGSVLFAGELDRWRLRRLSGHVVVCGLGRKGLQLTQDFLARGDKVVIIEKDEENEHLLAAREAGALVAQASVLLAVTGDDGANIETAVAARRLVHLANGSKPRVTVIDREAEERRKRFLGRCPGFTAVADLDLLEGDVEYADILTQLEEWGRDPGRLLDIVVCFDDDRRGLACGLALVERLREHRVPVRVRMSQGAGLSTLARGAGMGSWTGRLSTFGLLDRLCTRESVLGESLDQLARKAHEDYLRRKLAQEAAPGSRPSLGPWSELDEFYRESNRQ